MMLRRVGLRAGYDLLAILLLGASARRCTRHGIFLFCLAMPGLAIARSSWETERLHLATDNAGIVDVQGATVRGDFAYQLFILSGYSRAPLVLYVRDSAGRVAQGTLVENRVSFAVQGLFTLDDRLAIGLELPVVLFQNAGSTLAGSDLVGDVRGTGLGDLGLLTKLALLTAREHGADLAVLVSVRLPTSSPKGHYMGEEAGSLVPALAVGRDLGQWRIGANIGATLRRETDFFGIKRGHDLSYRFGAAHTLERFAGRPAELGVSLSGDTPLKRPFRRSAESPVELLVAGNVEVVGEWRVILGGGVGLVGGYTEPLARAFLGVGYVPTMENAPMRYGSVGP